VLAVALATVANALPTALPLYLRPLHHCLAVWWHGSLCHSYPIGSAPQGCLLAASAVLGVGSVYAALSARALAASTYPLFLDPLHPCQPPVLPAWQLVLCCCLALVFLAWALSLPLVWVWAAVLV